MVVNVEMEYDLKTPSSFQVVQKLVKIIQQQVYRMEGSFNKIIAYDGGFAVLCTWGLSPMSHTDDAARAVLAAVNMQKKLAYFFQVVVDMPEFIPPVHFGICTGSVLAGIVGATDRKEIVLLGETVERAFLFMQIATKVYGRIFVDYETKAEAAHHVDCHYLEHIQFADKLLNHPVFTPLDPFKEYDSSLPKRKTKYIMDISSELGASTDPAALESIHAGLRQPVPALVERALRVHGGNPANNRGHHQLHDGARGQRVDPRHQGQAWLRQEPVCSLPPYRCDQEPSADPESPLQQHPRKKQVLRKEPPVRVHRLFVQPGGSKAIRGNLAARPQTDARGAKQYHENASEWDPQQNA